MCMYSKMQQLYENETPSSRVRNEFSPKVRKQIKEIWGDGCYICENPRFQIHHVKYRSDCGRGTKRNGLPLCHFHHTDHTHGIHFNRKFRHRIENLFIETWGEEYYKDEYDLFFEGKINDPTKDLLEEYFEKGEAVWLK